MLLWVCSYITFPEEPLCDGCLEVSEYPWLAVSHAVASNPP